VLVIDEENSMDSNSLSNMVRHFFGSIIVSKRKSEKINKQTEDGGKISKKKRRDH